jgi:hypothetical protein
MTEPIGRSTAGFDGDETRAISARSRSDQQESFVKLLRALRAHPEPAIHAPLVSTIARWVPAGEVLDIIIAVPAWFDAWEVREALYGNPATDEGSRERIATCMAIFELARELDRPGLAADEKKEIKEEIRNQISFLEESDRNLVRGRLKSLAGKRKTEPIRPAAPLSAPETAPPAAEPVAAPVAPAPPPPPPIAPPAGIDPTLLALFADLQSTVAAHDEAVETRAVPDEDSFGLFGFGGERMTGIIEVPEIAPPPQPPPPPPGPPRPATPPPVAAAPPPPAPPVAAPSPPPVPPPPPPAPLPEEPQYMIVGGEIIPLVEGLDLEAIRRGLTTGTSAKPTPAPAPKPTPKPAPAAAPPRPSAPSPAAQQPLPPPPAAPPVPPSFPAPPAPPAEEVLFFVEELHPFDAPAAPPPRPAPPRPTAAPPPPPTPPPPPAPSQRAAPPPPPPPPAAPRAAMPPPGATPPPLPPSEPYGYDLASLSEEPPSEPTAAPAPKGPIAPQRPVYPRLGREERAELESLTLPQKLSLASTTDRIDVLDALLRMKDDKILQNVLGNPLLPDGLIALRAREFTPTQVKTILGNPMWKKKGDVLVGLLSNMVVTRDGAIAILKSMDSPADLLGVMRAPEIMNPQLKQMAKDRLVERYWAMPVRRRVELIRSEGTDVFQDLWEQVFRDEATLLELIESGNLDEDSSRKIATSPLAPRGVLDALAKTQVILRNPDLVESIVKNPKSSKSTATALIAHLTPEAKARLRKSITLSPALRAQLG